MSKASLGDGSYSPAVCLGCGVALPHTHPPRKWCSERCRKAQYRRPCAACGRPCGGSDLSTYCAECAKATNGERARERFAERRELVERLWAEGKTIRGVCEGVGVAYHKEYISNCRARGYNLPHRNRVGPLEKRLANLARGREIKLARKAAV